MGSLTWMDLSIPVDGSTLSLCLGADAPFTTVGGEVNSPATDVAYGRNHLRVHWTSDGFGSMRHGEQIADSIVWDQNERSERRLASNAHPRATVPTNQTARKRSTW